MILETYLLAIIEELTNELFRFVGNLIQLDIFAEFEIEPLGSQEIEEVNVGCGIGASDRSSFGPFGLLTIADDTLSELTPIYFRLYNTSQQNSTTFFCADETRYVQNFVFWF